jgi:hypothetical protein
VFLVLICGEGLTGEKKQNPCQLTKSFLVGEVCLAWNLQG